MENALSTHLLNLVNSPASESIDLPSMESLSLQIRFDSKFLISAQESISLLAEILEAYHILEVDGRRFQPYDSIYYDHVDMRSYNEHLRSKRNRYKVRKRSYVLSDVHVLEIKQKENTGRTLKHRFPLKDFNLELTTKQQMLLQAHGIASADLNHQIRVRFHRLTLASIFQRERVTIDFGLQYDRNEKHIEIPYLVLIEVKQGKKSRDSVMLEKLKARHIRTESFSKYCLGMSLLEPELKSNMYKEKILKINKMKTEYGILSNTLL